MNKKTFNEITELREKGDIYRTLKETENIRLQQSEIDHISITSVYIYFYLKGGNKFKVLRGRYD